ncbi:sigma-70 family RNA polymerase sigma factor [Singulisphaera sp. Ch08]|uniref:Sigma-70 family RNA polymerase sigma factor n=1 Tax=Singulisphaera sp. Ch08 TaxID=3120278 RepID=A0AAU7C8N4_9BACT
MATDQGGNILRPLHTLFRLGAIGQLTDGQLLTRFMERGGEAADAAFAALVERHGPMVLRVCRRVLDNPHDAQDAFQATFLVLVRRSSAVCRRDSLGSWLHGVALRVAGNARRRDLRRRRHERLNAERVPGADDCPDLGGKLDLERLLHEELGRLPDRYRAPMVLCYLEGRSCEEVAHRLNWPLGTVKSRLARGRERLRGRLVRRGVVPTVGTVVATLVAERAMGAIPVALEEGTIRAAIGLAAGRGATVKLVSLAAAELMEGALRTMTVSSRKAIAMGLLALGIAVVSTGSLMQRAVGDAPTPPSRELEMTPLPSYVVEPPDLIRVDVHEALPSQPIQGERLVRPDGKISLGYYGELYVAGLTPREIKEKLILHLRTFLTEEQLGLSVPDSTQSGRSRLVAAADSTRVSVEVTAYNSKVYYVQGDVASPGRIPITGRETVLDGLSYAGGLSSPAAESHIRLVRPVPGGRAPEKLLKVDYQAIVEKGDPTTNYQLRPGDRLIVSRDPKSKPTQEQEAKEQATNIAIERRLTAVERRLDRVIELLEGRKAPSPANESEPKPEGL